MRFGKFMRYSPIVRFSQTSPRAGAGPLRGQHNDSVLSELGYSADQIADLEERRIIAREEV